jgi:tetratricopeptide (TPR) repeat protein
MPARRELDRTIPDGAHTFAAPAGVDDPASALQWLDKRRSCIAAVAQLALDQGLHHEVVQLAHAFHVLIIVHKHHQLSIEIDTVALDASRLCRDRGGEFSALRRLARTYGKLGEHDRACELVEQIMDRAHAERDPVRMAKAQKARGAAYLNVGNVDGARIAATSFAEAAALYLEHDRPRAEGLARTKLAQAHDRLRQLDDAVTELQRAYHLLTSAEDSYNTARAKLVWAHVAMSQQDFATARRVANRAEQTMERLGASSEVDKARMLLDRIDDTEPPPLAGA